MNRSTIGLAALTLCLAAVSADAGRSKHITEETDPYTGLKILTLDVDTGECAVRTSPDPNHSHVRLIVSAVQAPDGGADYALVVDMSGGHSIHPGSHGSMETLIDGDAGKLQALGPKSRWMEHNRFQRGRHLRETIPFGADPDFLNALSHARQFQFRVIASDGTLERCTDAKELRDMDEFLGMAATL